MNIEESVSFKLSKLNIAHRNLLQKYVSEIGLHSGQVFLLIELWKADGQRQIDLAQNVQLSPPTVNKILGGLLEGDFVTRGKYEDDARSTRIFLTQKGRDISDAVSSQWMELEARTLSGLTDTEALILKQLLDKMLGQSGDV